MNFHRQLLCPRCCKYDCKLHGCFHVAPIVRVDPLKPIPCPVPGLALDKSMMKLLPKTTHDTGNYNGLDYKIELELTESWVCMYSDDVMMRVMMMGMVCCGNKIRTLMNINLIDVCVFFVLLDINIKVEKSEESEPTEQDVNIPLSDACLYRHFLLQNTPSQSSSSSDTEGVNKTEHPNNQTVLPVASDTVDGGNRDPAPLTAKSVSSGHVQSLSSATSHLPWTEAEEILAKKLVQMFGHQDMYVDIIIHSISCHCCR